jgi:hypothetical protein
MSCLLKLGNLVYLVNMIMMQSLNSSHCGQYAIISLLSQQNIVDLPLS